MWITTKLASQLHFKSFSVWRAPVIAEVCLAVSVITGRVCIALPVVRRGGAVSHTGPASNRQRAVLCWKSQTQTRQITVTPLEWLDSLQAVRSPWHVLARIIKMIFGLHWAARLPIGLLLYADGGCSDHTLLCADVLRVTNGLCWFTAAEKLFVPIQGLCAALGDALLWPSGPRQAPASPSRCEWWRRVRRGTDAWGPQWLIFICVLWGGRVMCCGANTRHSDVYE